MPLTHNAFPRKNALYSCCACERMNQSPIHFNRFNSLQNLLDPHCTGSFCLQFSVLFG